MQTDRNHRLSERTKLSKVSQINQKIRKNLNPKNTRKTRRKTRRTKKIPRKRMYNTVIKIDLEERRGAGKVREISTIEPINLKAKTQIITV